VPGEVDPGSLAPIPISAEQRRLDFRRTHVPRIVWGIATIAALGLMWGRSVGYRHVAIAEAPQFELSSPVPGKIASVFVQPYDLVSRGEVIAALDDGELRAELATTDATVTQLRAALEAERASSRADRDRQSADWDATRRRFRVDEERLHLDALAMQVDVESARIEEQRLKLEADRAERLLSAGLISSSEADSARLLQLEARKRIEETDHLLAETRAELDSTTSRRAGYEAQRPAGPSERAILTPLEAAIEVETRRLREIETRREALVLRSPIDGQVRMLVARPGQAVVAGEPVAVVGDREVREIVAYLRQEDRTRVEPDGRVLVVGRNRSAESTVLRVGESFEPMPVRLWRSPRVPDYGRAVVIQVAPELALTPGEVLEVRFR